MGGTGNWNDTSHWAYSSGGTPGAAVPNSSDNVYFDSNSGSSLGICTVNVNTATVPNITISGGWINNIASSGGGNNLNFSGTLSYTNTGAGAVTISAPLVGTGAAVTVNASGGTLTLSGTNTYTGTTTLTAGTLVAANTAALGDATAPLHLNGGTLDLAPATARP